VFLESDLIGAPVQSQHQRSSILVLDLDAGLDHTYYKRVKSQQDGTTNNVTPSHPLHLDKRFFLRFCLLSIFSQLSFFFGFFSVFFFFLEIPPLSVSLVII
jgi:hypothetical protein